MFLARIPVVYLLNVDPHKDLETLLHKLKNLIFMLLPAKRTCVQAERLQLIFVSNRSYVQGIEVGGGGKKEPNWKFNCILFWFTSMVVRLHSCVLANQLSPVAHWSKSMFCMSTSTRITPLTQTNTHTFGRSSSSSSSYEMVGYCWFGW